MNSRFINSSPDQTALSFISLELIFQLFIQLFLCRLRGDPNFRKFTVDISGISTIDEN